MSETQVTLEDLGIPPQFQRYVAPTTPPQMKQMAARGLVPAPPKVLLPLLYMLRHDPDAGVAQAAVDALKTLPARMVEGALDGDTHPWVLDLLAHERLADEKVIELVLLRPQLADPTMGFLAETVSERLLTIVSNNQARLLKTPELLRSIRKNPAATQGMLDRVESFLLMNDAMPEALAEEIVQPAGEAEYEFPPELIEEREVDKDILDVAALRKAKEAQSHDADPDSNNMWNLIQNMGIHARIQLATKGNATARAILIRSPLKLIAMAVINSPRITDPEVAAIAMNRNVIEEVLRKISTNKQWMRRYQIKAALVNNPKTPLSVTMPLVAGLANNELKALSKNRNVPSVLAKRARDLLKQRMK